MLTSLYQIAEQCKLITEKRVSVQALTFAVKDAYAQIAKKQWYANMAEDSGELNGSFLYTFKSVEPILDCDTDMYYIMIPSSYLELPHQLGVNWVSYMKDRTSFVLTSNWGIFSNLKSAIMGGRQVYSIENSRMWFPKMDQNSVGPLLLKLAIALDNVEPEDELNIAPNIVSDIIAMVVAPYMNNDNPIAKIREIIN